MPKRNPMQSYDEMLTDGEARKNTRLYRAESSEFVDGQLQALVGMAAAELAEIADRREKINLYDIDALKERTVLYVRSCEDTATIPTFSGLARSMGVSTEGLNDVMRRNPDSASAEWLRLTHDAFADCLAGAALRNLTNSIVSIFSLKARSGWKEAITLEAAAPNINLAPGDAELIAQKYGELPE